MGKKDRDSKKPRGRMSAYAYFVQDSRAEHGKNHPNSPVKFAEFSKDCSARWKSMGENGKGVFHEKSMRDKIRYDREMQSYKPAKGEKGNKRSRKRKDPDAPKRNLSAFFIFSGEHRASIKSVHPNWSVGDIAKELAVRWRSMGANDKVKYENGAAKDKERYIKAMAEYKAKAKTVKRQPRESSSSSSSDSSSDDSSSDDSDEE
ncbi:high mobility group protein 1 homolog [Lytechinus pictus]|uniref:high mobility group protein 1 homolog n=1 Tax=Lytechinus pictus TaxID=7653 RepID=UPI00240DD895|nr:high mobility group protein 1 homolog [Lytechinus pictus]